METSNEFPTNTNNTALGVVRGQMENLSLSGGLGERIQDTTTKSGK
jgi:hypothetical protein